MAFFSLIPKQFLALAVLTVCPTFLFGDETLAPLKLTDGRSFSDWSIIGHSEKYVTLKYAGGMGQIEISKLPPDLAAKYLPPPPVIELPPPGEELIAPKDRGYRYVERIDSPYSKSHIKWAIYFVGESAYFLITRTFYEDDHSPGKSDDGFLTVSYADVDKVTGIFERAQTWASSARQAMAPDFQKGIDVVNGCGFPQHYEFYWSSEAKVSIDGYWVYENDFEMVEKLLRSAKQVAWEQREKDKAAKAFADGLAAGSPVAEAKATEESRIAVTPKHDDGERERAAREARVAEAENEQRAHDEQVESVKKAATRYADHYFRYDFLSGVSGAVVDRLDIDLEEPTPVSGWVGRYAVEGKASLEFYDSAGISFEKKVAGPFTVTVECNGSQAKVADFSNHVSP